MRKKAWEARNVHYAVKGFKNSNTTQFLLLLSFDFTTVLSDSVSVLLSRALAKLQRLLLNLPKLLQSLQQPG